MNNDLIHAIPLPSLVVSDEDELLAANELALELFPGFQFGRSFLTVLRHPQLGSIVNAARAGAKPGSVDLQILAPMNQIFSATCTRFRSNSVLICLQDANETASAVKIRRDFIADLSHELRTPLTAIRGIVETIENDSAALDHFLPILSLEAERMNRLVDDLLALSRVERNERRRPSEDVCIQRVVQDACAALEPIASKMKVQIDTDLPDRELRLTGNSDELVRAVNNLIENALRYGGGGAVTVRLRLEDEKDSDGNAVLVLEVQDSGPGVEAHHIPRLTERFYRVDSHRSRETGGSGLGLAIVKHVATHHRGRLTFASAPNEGFKAIVALPGAKFTENEGGQ